MHKHWKSWPLEGLINLLLTLLSSLIVWLVYGTKGCVKLPQKGFINADCTVQPANCIPFVHMATRTYLNQSK